ncbi:hypothetical protein EDC04DRAFT_2607396 [Pisolithus marmoratus]|nr:hypothetical protein EDC04DRAFT_2607396 [Pisolithus marmoratus]
MSHVYFPKDVPSEDTLNELLATERPSKAVQGKDHEINIPGLYFNHMQCFMWRESAIQVVLKHADQLELQEDLANTLHKDSQKAAAKNLQWQSKAFNSYLRIEYWVMHHEPWLVREFRHSNDLNINRCKVQDLDWKAYDNKLGHLWSGVHTRFDVSDRAENNMQFLKTLHDHMKVFYDPIVAEDTNFGYMFKEHLPVEDPDQEEGWDQEGQEQDDAMSQEV